MSIKLDLTADVSSLYNGVKGYFDYFQSAYSSPGHASDMWFHNNPGSLDIGGTVYNDTYFGIKVIGEHLANTSTATNASFLVKANEVTLEDGSGAHYQANDMIYSGGTNPAAHRLAGDINTLEFGNGDYASGDLASTLLTISNLTQHIGNGLLDTDSDGAYDAINGNTGTNLVHQLIYNLMGGMGGAGGTSVLEDFLNTYGTEQVGTTTGSDRFDPFNALDTFVLNGGNDFINAGFQTGAGGDVIDLSGYNTFANASDALNAVFYSSLFGDAFLTYQDASSNYHSVRITGVTSGLTEDNFIV